MPKKTKVIIAVQLLVFNDAYLLFQECCPVHHLQVRGQRARGPGLSGLSRHHSGVGLVQSTAVTSLSRVFHESVTSPYTGVDEGRNKARSLSVKFARGDDVFVLSI